MHTLDSIFYPYFTEFGADITIRGRYLLEDDILLPVPVLITMTSSRILILQQLTNLSTIAQYTAALLKYDSMDAVRYIELLWMINHAGPLLQLPTYGEVVFSM